jgi:hypothetical protein
VTTILCCVLRWIRNISSFRETRMIDHMAYVQTYPFYTIHMDSNASSIPGSPLRCDRFLLNSVGLQNWKNPHGAERLTHMYVCAPPNIFSRATRFLNVTRLTWLPRLAGLYCSRPHFPIRTHLVCCVMFRCQWQCRPSFFQLRPRSGLNVYPYPPEGLIGWQKCWDTSAYLWRLLAPVFILVILYA